MNQTDNKHPYTEIEQKISNLLVEAHNLFAQLEQIHPSHITDWVTGIHTCQYILQARVVARDYPDYFYNALDGKTDQD